MIDLAKTRMASTWHLDYNFPYALIEDVVNISNIYSY